MHDWLVTLRGGERVLDALCELWPEATLHTLVRVPGVATERIEAMRHVTSLADRLPLAHRRHRWLLPVYPAAIEALDLSGFDLVVSSSHCVAKGVRVDPSALHVCYCHTPVRYAWDRTSDYVEGSGLAVRAARPVLELAAAWLRAWDARTADRVHAFVANSENTAGKIARFYRRTATVVAPPVEVDRFASVERLESEYDLVLSGLVPYKRVDLAIRAYALMPHRHLVVAGDGPERARLQRIAPANVSFRGRVAEAALPDLYARARLLVFPGEEDFGIVPLEAQAAGVPVVAYAKGGALESVVAGQTGAFFDEASPQALAAAVESLDALKISSDVCRSQARRFDRTAFLGRMSTAVDSALAARAVGRDHEPTSGAPTGSGRSTKGTS